MSVQEGETAPEFELPASGGRTVSRKAMQGKPFVLYFYPKADTPGCTKEACAFQEALPQLGNIGIDVIGVSPDKMKPIEKFADEISSELPARLGRDACGGGEIWHLGRKIHVWTQVYGHRAQHVPDRQVWEDCQGMAQGQRHRPRGRGAGGGAGAGLTPVFLVILAKAKIQGPRHSAAAPGFPAFAGMTKEATHGAHR